MGRAHGSCICTLVEESDNLKLRPSLLDGERRHSHPLGVESPPFTRHIDQAKVLARWKLKPRNAALEGGSRSGRYQLALQVADERKFGPAKYVSNFVPLYRSVR